MHANSSTISVKMKVKKPQQDRGKPQGQPSVPDEQDPVH